jgi:hypothetical protein
MACVVPPVEKREFDGERRKQSFSSCPSSRSRSFQMSIKRQIEGNVEQPEKKTKLDETFPIETFVKNLKDPESCFLGESAAFEKRHETRLRSSA